jgi:hypothetical protein
MRYLLLLIATSAMTACGQAPSSATQCQPSEANSCQSTTTDQGGQVDHGPDQKQVVTEYKKTANNVAIALADSKDLPECSLANDKQLAYIKNEDTFYACDAIAATWTIVDIKGSKGDQGPIGPSGSNGKDGEVATLNMWVDPITGLKWLIGGQANRTEAQNFCTDPYRLPTEPEAYMASQHGLGLASHAISGPTSLWSDDFSNYGVDGLTPFYRFIDLSSPNQLATDSASAIHGVVCVHIE